MSLDNTIVWCVLYDTFGISKTKCQQCHIDAKHCCHYILLSSKKDASNFRRDILFVILLKSAKEARHHTSMAVNSHICLYHMSFISSGGGSTPILNLL